MLNPSISNLFNITKDESKIFIETEISNLYVFSIFYINSDNSNSKLKEIFDSANKNFDYIIVDMPSSEHISYIQDISHLTEGCIFVIKEGFVDINEFLNTKEILEKSAVNIIGTVLNKEINQKCAKDNASKTIKLKLITKQLRKEELICQEKVH